MFLFSKKIDGFYCLLDEWKLLRFQGFRSRMWQFSFVWERVGALYHGVFSFQATSGIDHSSYTAASRYRVQFFLNVLSDLLETRRAKPFILNMGSMLFLTVSRPLFLCSPADLLGQLPYFFYLISDFL